MILKLKKFNIVIVVVVLIVLIILAAILKVITAPKSENRIDASPTSNEIFPTIDENVEVDLKFVNNNRGMELTISNIPEDVDTIDYEVSYTTGEGLPKGNIGTIRLKSGEKKITRSGEELTLGTCSRGRCVYYEGVTEVNLSLKFNFSDASAKIFQKKYSIEE